MESVLAEKPFQARSWIFQLGVWSDGRVYGEVEDSLGGEYLSLKDWKGAELMNVLRRPIAQRPTLAIWRY